MPRCKLKWCCHLSPFALDGLLARKEDGFLVPLGSLDPLATRRHDMGDARLAPDFVRYTPESGRKTRQVISAAFDP